MYNLLHCLNTVSISSIVNISYFYLSDISPVVVVEIDTVSDEDPESIKAAVEEALSEALSDNIVGNLNVDPDSATVDEPHVPETETETGTSNGPCFQNHILWCARLAECSVL